MPLATGDKLGPYEILAPIGKGGMGEVYRAHDTRLHRDVAIKTLHYEFAIPPLAFNHFYGNMYPLYVRGLAYMALHREQDAAVEFSRLLAHPGLATGDPVDARLCDPLRIQKRANRRSSSTPTSTHPPRPAAALRPAARTPSYTA